jgi:REP element-mobilizing transposase RayT
MPTHDDRDVHHRPSIRLQGYDYAQGGAYFVTLCTFNRECLFGDVIDGELRLSDIGEIVEREWQQTPIVRPSVLLDVFVVMPNHVHGIIVLPDMGGTTRDRGDEGATSQKATPRGHPRVAPTNITTHRVAPTTAMPTRRVAPTGPAPGSIGAVIGQFRSIATKRIRSTCRLPDLIVWQRNYYDHVIRNERDLDRIRQYIVNNPARWADDENHPTNIRP